MCKIKKMMKSIVCCMLVFIVMLSFNKVDINGELEETIRVIQADVGEHLLLLMDDGSVMACGNNSYGQLGIGTYENQPLPVKIPGLVNVKQVAVADRGGFSVALTDDGKIFVWGGYIVNGEFRNISRPKEMFQMDGIIDMVDTGSSFILRNENGKNYEVKYFEDEIIEFESKDWIVKYDSVIMPLRVVKLLSDGTLIIEDRGNYDIGDKRFSGEDIIEFFYIKNVHGDLVTLSSNGKITIWSDDMTRRYEEEKLSNVVDIASDGWVVYALLEDGTLYEYELGSKKVVKIESSKLGKELFVNYYPPSGYIFIGVINKDGSVSTMGDNTYGQLGVGKQNYFSEPFKLSGISEVVDIEIGDETAIIQMKNGDVLTAGEYAEVKSSVITRFADQTQEEKDAGDQPSLIDIGESAVIKSSEYPFLKLELSSEVEKIHAIDNFYAVVTKGGKVTEWGPNDITYYSDLKRVQEFESEIVMIDASEYQRIALLEDQSVYQWGSAVVGGHRVRYGQDGKIRPSIQKVPDVEKAVKVCAGLDYAYAILEDGTVMTWGYNGSGQLGQGNTEYFNEKTVDIPEVFGAKDIVTYNDSTFAIMGDGSVYGWGHVLTSEQMDKFGSNKVYTTPIKLPGLDNVKAINNGFVLKNNGEVYIMSYGGYNYENVGQILLTDVKEIFSASGFNSIALMNDGTVKIYTSDYSFETIKGLSNITKVAIGSTNTSDSQFLYALTVDGDIYAWGTNNYDVFGLGYDRFETSMVDVVFKAEALISPMVFQIDNSTMFDGTNNIVIDAAPIINENRTMLPLRAIAEALGASVAWDESESEITIENDDKIIELWLGSNVAKINGKEVFIDAGNTAVVPIVMAPGRTFVPVRFIAEAFQSEVKWLEDTKEVLIY